MNNKNVIGGVSPLKAKGRGKRQASRGGKSAGRATATAKRRGGFAKSKGKRGAGGRNVGGYNVQTRFKADKWTPPPSGGTTRLPKPYSYDPGGNLTVNPPSTTTTTTTNADANAKANADGLVWVPGEKGTGHWETQTWKSGGGNRESFSQVWTRNGSRYSKSGQSSRMSDKYANTLGLKSQQKGGRVVHKTFDDYVNYMEAANAWHKTKEGKQWESDNLSSAKEKTHSKQVWVEDTPGTPGHYITVKGGGATAEASSKSSTETKTTTN